jgi:hypothetical protein
MNHHAQAELIFKQNRGPGVGRQNRSDEDRQYYAAAAMPTRESDEVEKATTAYVWNEEKAARLWAAVICSL